MDRRRMSEAELEDHLRWGSELLVRGEAAPAAVARLRAEIGEAWTESVLKRQSRLKGVLDAEFGPLSAAYILRHIPEQGEDIYDIAIPPDLVATVEVPYRWNTIDQPLVQRQSWDEYRRAFRRLPRDVRRELAVVERLLRNQK
jgi:hypothetical protein